MDDDIVIAILSTQKVLNLNWIVQSHRVQKAQNEYETSYLRPNQPSQNGFGSHCFCVFSLFPLSYFKIPAVQLQIN